MHSDSNQHQPAARRFHTGVTPDVRPSMGSGISRSGLVNPAHSRRMTARLQAATSSTHPILVRGSSASGHGMGTALSEKIAQKAEVMVFLFDQLGMKARD